MFRTIPLIVDEIMNNQGYFEDQDPRTGKALKHQAAAQKAAKKAANDISNAEIIPMKDTFHEDAVPLSTLMMQTGGYIVGGYVRDKIMGNEPHDVDLASPMWPKIILEMFKHSFEMGFGTVAVRTSDHGFVEITTFRKEGAGRHPTVKFTTDLKTDLGRRDFTMNAMAMDKDGNIIDFYDGRKHIEQKIIVSTYDPYEMLSNDPLRAIRGIRFSHRHGFMIESTLDAAIRQTDLSSLSGERLFMELEKMFDIDASSAVEILDEYGVLEKILSEIKDMQKCEHNPIHHPDGNCFEHTLCVLEYLKYENMITKVCGMLHDVGKPEVHEKGCLSYHGHDKAGIDIGKAIMKRFGRPKSEIDAVAFVIKNHMKMHKLEEMKASKRRKLYDSPYFGILLKVVQADGSMRGFSPRLIEDFVNQDVITRTTQVKPLIDGNIIMSYGIAPGPMIKEIQNDIVEQQIEGNITTEKEALQYFMEHYARTI